MKQPVNCNECGKELDVEYDPCVDLTFCCKEHAEKFHDRHNKLRKDIGLPPLTLVSFKGA